MHVPTRSFWHMAQKRELYFTVYVYLFILEKTAWLLVCGNVHVQVNIFFSI